MWSAKCCAASSIRENRSGLVPGAASPTPVSRANYFVPGSLVIGSDPLLDLRVTDDQKAPTLHIAARRGRCARFKDLPYQGRWHRIGFQPPHRAGRLHDLE